MHGAFFSGPGPSARLDCKTPDQVVGVIGAVPSAKLDRFVNPTLEVAAVATGGPLYKAWTPEQGTRERQIHSVSERTLRHFSALQSANP